MRFSLIEVRVLGCLIEKEISTPEYYPLTLNSLVAACNQKSNRDPAMLLDDKTVVRTLEDLRYNQQIVRQISSTGSRVPKYKHTVPDHWGFTLPELAVMCELCLRGPQTIGQLRTRTARLHDFASIEEVEATLEALVTWEDGPFVVQLPREPGCREQRWAHLLSGEPVIETVASEARPEPARLVVQAENERIAALEIEVASLRSGFDQLLAEFAAFRRQFD
ncbi:MAG: YceH family protein [Kiritimatiellae bacterium]|nr:YceH family protein [Kiritimatiellia bacterium]